MFVILLNLVAYSVDSNIVSSSQVSRAITLPTVITYEVSVPSEINVSSASSIGGWIFKDYAATWLTNVRGGRKVITVSFTDTDGDAYVILTGLHRRSCTLDFGNDHGDFTAKVTTMEQAGLECSAGTPSDGSTAVIVEAVKAYAGHSADCVWKGACSFLSG